VGELTISTRSSQPLRYPSTISIPPTHQLDHYSFKNFWWHSVDLISAAVTVAGQAVRAHVCVGAWKKRRGRGV